MDKKRYYIFLIIAVISFGLLLAGGTYAWLIFNDVSIGNNNLTGNTSSFLIDYTANLTGELMPSSTYEGGISGTVTAKINDNSSVDYATGSLYLYADSNTTSSILYEGTELGVALKYVVLDGSTVVASGTVTSDIVKVSTIATKTSDSNIKTTVPSGMLIYEDFDIIKTNSETYTVYLWLDGNLVDNRYLDLSFSGSINLKAVQKDDLSQPDDDYLGQ